MKLGRCIALSAAVAALGCNTHREAPVTQVAPSVEAAAPSVEAAAPPVEAAAPSAVVVDAAAVAIAIANVQTFVTTRGPPDHVRLSVANHGPVASTVSIRGVDWVDGSLRRGLTIRSLDVDVLSSRPDAAGGFVVLPGSTVAVTVSIAGDALPPNAAAYAFVVTAAVDGVAREVEVYVHRARREPRYP